MGAQVALLLSMSKKMDGGGMGERCKCWEKRSVVGRDQGYCCNHFGRGGISLGGGGGSTMDRPATSLIVPYDSAILQQKTPCSVIDP